MTKKLTLKNDIGIDSINFRFSLGDCPFLIPDELLKNSCAYCSKAHHDDLCIAMDSKGISYKYIKLTISKHEIVFIKIIRNKIVATIELTRRPLLHHEILGNIENATYSEVDQQLNFVLGNMKRMIGLSLDNIEIHISSIEINRTFITPFDFIMSSRFFMYLTQGNNYYAQVTYNKRLNSTDELSPIDERTNKIAKINSEIVIYDKKRETQEQYENLMIDEEILRVEFRAKREDVIKAWFGTHCWSELSQTKIEDTYFHLCEERLFDSFEHVKQLRKEKLGVFVLHYKSSKKFKDSLIDFYNKTLNEYKFPISISEDEFDIQAEIRANHILNKNCKNTKKYFSYYKDVINKWGHFYDPKTSTFLSLEYIKNYIFDCLTNQTQPYLEVHYTS